MHEKPFYMMAYALLSSPMKAIVTVCLTVLVESNGIESRVT